MSEKLTEIKDKLTTKLHHGTNATLAGHKVGPIGYGLMGLSWRDHQTEDEQAFAAMKAALANGCNFWDGGLFYGTEDSNNLHLLSRYFQKYPEDASKVVLSVKAGLPPNHSGSKSNVDSEVEKCLKILDPSVKKIDIFQMCRVDPETPVAETLSFIYEHVKADRIGGIGISEVGPETVKKAVKAANIAAVEIEMSLFSTEVIENGTLKACAEANVPVVAYSPLGKGFLTGQIRSPKDFPAGDPGAHVPRYSPENFHLNLELVDEVNKIAKKKGCSPGQLAIAWILTVSDQSGMPEIIPIPGATRAERVEENAATAKFKLSKEEMEEIETLLKKMPVSGARNPEQLQAMEAK